MSTTTTTSTTPALHDVGSDDPESEHHHHAENGSTRPYSIDEALELEHSLNLESPMATHFPDHPTAAHSRGPSMDTAVLKHIVTQLRESLERSEATRDEALEKMRKAEEEAGEATSALKLEREGFSETIRNLTEKCTKLEDEAITMKLKSDADEHAINMLRTKVEESRRGLMRIQSESRRTSTQLSPPTGLAALVTSSTSKRDKRASFTPLTGSIQHRRMSSLDHGGSSTFDSGLLSPTGSVGGTSPVPSSTFHAQMNDTAPPPSLSRFGSLFSNASPPKSVDSQLPLTPSPEPSLLLTDEIDSLKKELATAKADLMTTKATLETTRHDLHEANEAKEASEQCVKALRTYIADDKPAALSLPPLPSMTNGDEEASAAPKTATAASSTGWGFGKLWKAEATTTTAGESSSPPTSMPSAPPVSRKFGSFWSSSRASISSISSTETRPLPNFSPASQSYLNTAESDTSSIVDSVLEPISPDRDAPTDMDITVRTGSASSSVAEEHKLALAPTPPSDPVVVVSGP